MINMENVNVTMYHEKEGYSSYTTRNQYTVRVQKVGLEYIEKLLSGKWIYSQFYINI